MKPAPAHPDGAANSWTGFTLAEVAVTLLIVGIGLVYVLQGINAAKITALYTYQKKVAREMATLTLGQIESGLFWEEVDVGGDTIQGTYAEEGYEAYEWEVVFGREEEFTTRLDSDYDDPYDPRSSGRFDSLTYRRKLEAERDDDDEDELASEEPFEEVRIRVTLAAEFGGRELITLERWVPWKLVYGESEEDTAEEENPLE